MFAAPALTMIGTRGWATALFFVARALVASVGVAAGIALWRGEPHARALALAALVLSTLASAITLTTTLLPSSIMPGDQWIYLALIFAFNGAWILYLLRH